MKTKPQEEWLVAFDMQLLSFFKLQREKAVAGSSIDKRYLQQYFLGLNQFFEYKKSKLQASVSSIKYEGYDAGLQYQLGAIYQVSKNIKSKYLHSKNIKFPSLYQLYAPEPISPVSGTMKLLWSDKNFVKR